MELFRARPTGQSKDWGEKRPNSTAKCASLIIGTAGKET